MQLDPDLTAALEAAVDKKAEDLVALDVSAVCDFTGTLVICHGNSSRHVKTVADEVVRVLRDRGRKPHHVEGLGRAEWVLMDYLDFVLHVFLDERRQFYALEHLWGDAPRIDLGSLAYVEAQANYALFVFDSGESVMSLVSLRKLEEMLPDGFVRIHRSFIVNAKRICSIEGAKLGLPSRFLPIGQSYREGLMEKLKVIN